MTSTFDSPSINNLPGRTSYSGASQGTPRSARVVHYTPRGPLNSGYDSPPSDSAGDSDNDFQMEELRNEIRAKNTSVSSLNKDIAHLKRTIRSKEDILNDTQSRLDGAEEELLRRQEELASLKKYVSTLEVAHKKMKKEVEHAESEADRMNKLLLSQSNSTSASLGDANDEIRRLENALTQAKKDIEQLRKDNKGCYAQINAKDEAIERQGAKVREAEEIINQQKDLQNTITRLRRELAEAQNQLRGSGALQAMSGQEAIHAMKNHKKAMADLDSARKLIAKMKAEAEVTQNALVKGQMRIGELEAEVSDARIQLERSKTDNTRKFNSPLIADFNEDELTRARFETSKVATQLASAKQELAAAIRQRDRVLDELDDISTQLEAIPGPDGVAVYDEVVNSLRLELMDLRLQISARDADNAALEHACEASAAGAALERIKVKALRVRLGEVMDPLEYQNEFKKAAPTKEDITALEMEAKNWQKSAVKAAHSWNDTKAHAAEVRAKVIKREKQLKKKDLSPSRLPSVTASGAIVEAAATPVSKPAAARGLDMGEGPDSVPSTPRDANWDDLQQRTFTEAETNKAQLQKSLQTSAATVRKLLRGESNQWAMGADRRRDEINTLDRTVQTLQKCVAEREQYWMGREEAFRREIALLRGALSASRSRSPLKKLKDALKSPAKQ